MSESISLKDVLEGKDKHMILEKNRLNSFTNWPFSDGNCTKEKMSASGFYQCNIVDDTVRCFCCFKELNGWESTDDPSTEHMRNNICFFANMAKSEKQLNLREFIQVIEEREINLLEKLVGQIKSEEKELLEQLGLSSDSSQIEN